jgi:NAD(P)-dependent dehydrogenase (short-subunit alcohol dehydrogenase family)
MTDQRLKGRIAIITGGSSGIGMATAFKFANSGARIIVADLRSGGVEE